MMIWLLVIPTLFYCLILLEICRNLRKVKPFKQEAIPLTKVSVVIACRNEEKNLPFLLIDLHSQDYNPELFEVIIVDDNSTDNTLRTALAYNQIKNLKILRNPLNGKKSAVRTGVANSSGELILTTDADCRMGEKWISTVSAFYCETKPDMIISPVEMETKPGFFGRFQELEFLSLQGVTAGTALDGNPVMCNGANLAFTRSAYMRHSEKLHAELLSGDDIFLLHSLKKENKSKIVWLSSAYGTVTTCQTDTFIEFIRQRARWISKAKAYNDSFTLLISIVTFVTIIANISLLIAGLFYQKLLLLFVASYFLKSIPDFIILSETTGRYNKKYLLKWFIPSSLIYPFYVIIVACHSIIGGDKWK
jgi:biofilm PGA synthesis N-glycosyltransferase PgaC